MTWLTPTRRQLVHCLIGGALSLSGLWCPGRVAAERLTPSDALTLKLARVSRCPESAKRVGAVYLQNTPAEAHPDTLVACLCVGGGLRKSELTQASVKQLRFRFAKLIRDDFANDRMVSLDGWMLSTTEARLCALVALG